MKLTAKTVKARYSNVIQWGYGEGQYLSKGLCKLGYTVGVYGWNADVLLVNNDTVLCTGYRPFGTIRPDRDLTKKFDDMAYKIYCNNNISYNDRIDQIGDIWAEYIKHI